MNDNSQPEYCDCDGFHDGSCRDRRLEILEKLTVELEESLTQKEKRIAQFERVGKRVFDLLSDANNKAHLDIITKSGPIGRAVSHSIQDLDVVLHGESRHNKDCTTVEKISIYTSENVQKLLERCFSLGLEAGRNEYFISDYCVSQEQEEEAINALHKQLLSFYNETGFKIGF
jgi:hypothetical protein